MYLLDLVLEQVLISTAVLPVQLYSCRAIADTVEHSCTVQLYRVQRCNRSYYYSYRLELLVASYSNSYYSVVDLHAVLVREGDGTVARCAATILQATTAVQLYSCMWYLLDLVHI